MKIYNVSLWSVKVPKIIQKGHCVCEPHVINVQSKPSTYWSPWFIEKYFHHNFVFKNFVNKLKISMVAILINVLSEIFKKFTKVQVIYSNDHCVKNVQIRSWSDFYIDSCFCFCSSGGIFQTRKDLWRAAAGRRRDW